MLFFIIVSKLFHVIFLHCYNFLNTVLLKGNVANKRLSLLVSRLNSHATRETKRTELKPLWRRRIGI